MKTNIIASNFREFIVKTLADFVRLGHWISFTIICIYWVICPIWALKSSVTAGLMDTAGLRPQHLSFSESIKQVFHRAMGVCLRRYKITNWPFIYMLGIILIRGIIIISVYSVPGKDSKRGFGVRIIHTASSQLSAHLSSLNMETAGSKLDKLFCRR